MAGNWYCVPVLLAALVAAPGLTQGTCGPSILGQPCGQGGIAILPNSDPALNLGVGNPIHLITGNKYQQELDLPAGPAWPRLEVVRHYNALDQRHGVLGHGWSLSYEARVFRVAGHWQIVQPDGSRVMFTNDPQHGTLTLPEGDPVWTWPSGRRLQFDAAGRLVKITFEAGDSLSIERSTVAGPLAGAITKISNERGGALVFHYRLAGSHAYLTQIDSPAGAFRYAYEPLPSRVDPGRESGALRLQALTRPDGMQRRYLYEAQQQGGNPSQLTGIELVSADSQHRKRTNSWVYDARGRVTESAQGASGSTSTLSMEYVRAPTRHENGLTVVTGANGQITRFLTAIRRSRYVLLRASGAGCPGCAAPGSQASYDDHGRLTDINGTLIDRSASGAVQRLRPRVVGWPGLALRYMENGYRASWSSALTGSEQMRYDDRQRPVQRLFANGDRWQYRYDDDGRPIELLETNGQGTVATRLGWLGLRLARIEHPHETEERHYDAHGRLRSRSVERPSWSPTATGGNAPWRYSERFDYDADHRLVRHELPEGGALHYRWGPASRLQAIDWHDRSGRVHPVIAAQPDTAGYDYGNGLHLRVSLAGGQADELVVRSGQTTVWSQRQLYDERGLLRHERHHIPSENITDTWQYAYNAASQLTGAHHVADQSLAPAAGATEAAGAARAAASAGAAGTPTAGDTVWFAWHNDGSLAAQRIHGKTIRPVIRRDASGLPAAAQGYTLRYGANRRLTHVARDGELLDRYIHNAFGQRVRKRSPRARTDYLYWNNQLLAEGRRTAAAPGTDDGFAVTRRYIYAQHVLVGLIDYTDSYQDTSTGDALNSGQARLYAVHSDLTGAPRLVTDADRTIRWLARYSPTGTASRVAGDLSLQLRLPGQIADPSTGWHDNLLRTYLPGSGHYLEPDPLGPVPGNQALGYADQQPRRHADPLGLLLFAFDGTRSNPQSQTNVWKMSQTYSDGPVFYHSGPGTPGQMDWDAIGAYNAAAIIDTQWRSLLDELAGAVAGTDTIPIDIIGYSRGAALARHFGNLINSHVSNGFFSYTDALRGLVTACLDLRFMGLFDTVAQFGLLGAQNANYDLTVAAAWEWVAHAVALHERRWLFPVTAAAGSVGGNVVERPFIGAHADIGGGLSFDDAGAAVSHGDLSDVALNWMLWQARAATVGFMPGPQADREITDPVLHDLRSPVARSIQNGDRRVDEPGGAIQHSYQDDHPGLGRVQRAATEKLITRNDDWRRAPATDVGRVDMDGYAQWLHDELGWQAIARSKAPQHAHPT